MRSRLARHVRRPSPTLRHLLLGALALGLLATVFAQRANPISFRSEIYIVSQITRDDGSKEERFTAATEAIPGQVVEFRIFATNTGDTTLPAGVVQLFGPIEAGMQYVPNSATPTSDRLLTEYSVDGVTFSAPPVLVGEEGEVRRVADPTEYTMIRWTLLVPMEPGQEEPLAYRVLLVQ